MGRTAGGMQNTAEEQDRIPKPYPGKTHTIDLGTLTTSHLEATQAAFCTHERS